MLQERLKRPKGVILKGLNPYIGSNPVLTTKQQTYMVEIILGALLITSFSIVTFTYWYKEIHKKR